jgi:hypothetical protein
LRLLGQLPVSDALELLIGHVWSQLGHRVGAQIAAVRHDRSQHGTDVLGRRLLTLSGCQEVAREGKLVIHLD